ncbi:helix-turn-helix domain-containing protein [Catenuloplanes atrovinosus]|uniref:Transcriptional regulator with XRE-family HTH domain n=1 Tax=Catenuloplanes atrovinosus TaxID=137266 RepID=A0AAE3YSN6_9ACTN|nr:helix-turn-helix transcriptional regulator [Catenuloplanes atrovinosus]MDR7279169.1 transcriptional regulator with XRE-family HTH domain [Catenuloplanes atrovinosus]
MAVKPSPTTLRRQLGAELRRLRDAAGRTVADVARSLGWSESKLSRIETAHTGIRNRDLDALLDTYDVPEDDRRRIRAVAVQSRQRAWWEAYGDVLPDAYETYIGFEAEVVRLRAYEALLVPGLLQTDEYAREIFRTDDLRPDGRPLRDDEIEQRAAVRLARQAVIGRQPAPDLLWVLDEAVLRRRVGGREVQRRQLGRLVEVSDRPNVTILVVPFDAGAHSGLAGSFCIMDFAGGERLVYADSRTGGAFRDRPEEVDGYATSFEGLRDVALPAEKSIEFIRAAAREM